MARRPEVTHRRETSGMLGQSLVDWGGGGGGSFRLETLFGAPHPKMPGLHLQRTNVLQEQMWCIPCGPCAPREPPQIMKRRWVHFLHHLAARGAQSFTRHIPAAQKPAEATHPSGCLEETSGHPFLGLPALHYFRLLGGSAWIHRGGYHHPLYKIKPPTPIRDRTTMRVRRPAGSAGEESDSEQGLLPDCPG